MLEQHLDLVADLQIGEVLELFERNAAFRLEADVEHDEVVANLQHVRLDDLSLVDGRHRAVVHLHHRFELVGRVTLVVNEFGTQVGKRAKDCALRVALLARGQCRAGRGLKLCHT